MKKSFDTILKRCILIGIRCFNTDFDINSVWLTITSLQPRSVDVYLVIKPEDVPVLHERFRYDIAMLATQNIDRDKIW